MFEKEPKKETEKLTREEVISRLERGKNLENLILSDLDLAGLNLEGKSFRRSDIRGIRLYREEQGEDGQIVEIKTNVKGADFTDAVIADFSSEVFFGRVDAREAIFGYTEKLISRRKRHEESGEIPTAEETGGLFSFNGSEGDFRKTKWINADFGGGSKTHGYEAIFPGANLSESIIEGCDLSGMDFSEANIDNIKIIDPISLSEMKINENQIDSVNQAIQLADQEKQTEFLKEKKEKGSKQALKDYFKIIILD